MSLFQPSELMRFLESIGQKPSKRLSQNFLIDGNILKKIVDAGHLEEENLVIEIGPGPGVLTESLLLSKARVVAIEKDPVFAKALHRFKTSENDLRVFEQDVLKFPFEEFLKKELRSFEKAKIISNLPYHLTSPIFDRILPLYPYVDDIIVMVQKEVADRIVAAKGSKTVSCFSVFCQFFSDPKLLFSVSPSCFFPKPKVVSAVVHLRLKKPPENIDPEKFLSFVRLGYGSRRKMLASSLKKNYDPDLIKKAFEKYHLDETLRPEQLSLKDWTDLFLDLEKPSSF